MTGILSAAIAVILRILSNPLSNVLQKQLTAKGNHPLVVNFLTYFILSILCVFISLNIEWPHLPSEFWVYSVLGGIAGALGNGFLVKALQSGDLSVLGPINSYKAIVGLTLAIFLLGEMPDIWGLSGIALIVYGSYFVLETTEDRFSLALFKRKAIQYRLWAMVLTAIEAVFVKKVILASSTMISFISWCWFGALFSFLLLVVYNINILGAERKHAFMNLRKYLYLVICIGTMQDPIKVRISIIIVIVAPR